MTKIYPLFILIWVSFLLGTSCNTNIYLTPNINKKDINNQKNDLWICADTVTNRIIISKYKNGKLNGCYLSYYYNNGILSEKGCYKNGEKYGVWRSYTIQGCPSSVIRYNRKGQVISIKLYNNGW